MNASLEKVLPHQLHIAVLDAANGLMWAADDVCADLLTHEQAAQACADFRLLGHTNWRLPTIQELLTCVDYTRREPAANTDFHRIKSAAYWTSSVASWSSGAAWIVNFGLGLSDHLDRGYRARVRAVRSWSAPVAGQ